MSIELIVGPMYAGKTSELLRRARRHAIGQRSVLVVKYAGDCRYDAAQVCTHDAVKSGNQQVVVAAQLSSAAEAAAACEVLCIDEGQFFPDLAPLCERWASAGKRVIVAALDGTFERKPFPAVCELLPLCDEVTKLCAVCDLCGGEAPFSQLLISAPENLCNSELIGGPDRYAARCRACYGAVKS